MRINKKTAEFRNRKAYFDYDILERYEAGIVLNGLEVKAIRQGRVSLDGSHAKIISGEVFWLGGAIGIKEGGEQRTKKLLLKKKEVNKIFGKLTQDRLLLIPLKLYFSRGKAKLLLGVCRGRKKYNKKELLKKRDLLHEQKLKFRKIS